jgi:hypothetical protein
MNTNQTPGPTANLRVEQWDTKRWAIMANSQIVYYAKDEVDARVTLEQWGAAPLLQTALYALYHLTVAMKGDGNAGVSQLCREALESVHGGPISDTSLNVARLIAAAPELLEALMEVDGYMTLDETQKVDSFTGRARMAVREAIAKATNTP